MKFFVTTIAMLFAISMGSLIGSLVYQPTTVHATEYLPIYKGPPNDQTPSLISINSNTGEVTVTGTNKPLSVQIERPVKQITQVKYITNYKDTKKLKEQLETAHKVIRYLISYKSCDKLKLSIPEPFCTSGREEEPDSVNHSQ